MTCKEAQGLIMSYINDKLDNEELEQFLNHIELCSDCKEELEVYFTLLTGMKQLDEDKNLSGNFHIDFEKSLHKSEERIRRFKLNYVRKRMIYIIACFVFCIMVNTNTDNQTNLESPEEVVEESTYFMKYYYFQDKETPLKRVFETYHEEMMQYIIKYQTEHLIQLEGDKIGASLNLEKKIKEDIAPNEDGDIEADIGSISGKEDKLDE